MTIYDVLRNIIVHVPWGGADDIEEHRRTAVALQLVDRCEEQALWGQIAIDIEEQLTT